MKQILQETSQVPYSTVRAFQLCQGITPNDKLGGNCVFHRNKISSLLDTDGYTHYTIQSLTPSQVHYASLVNDGGDFYYLDSTIRQSEPMNISAIIRSREVKTIVCEPIITQHPDIIRCTPKSDTEFHIDFCCYKDGEYKPALHWEYDIKQSITEELPPENSRAISMQSAGRICASSLLEKRTSLGILNIKKGVIQATKWDNDGMHRYINTEDPTGFNKVLETYSDETQCSVEEIIQSLQEGEQGVKIERKRK